MGKGRRSARSRVGNGAPSLRRSGDRPIITLPAGAFVVTVGMAGSGKTTFLRRTFPPEVIVSSDAVRKELLGDAADHRREPDVWATVYERVHQRLARGLLTVLDSTASSGPQRHQAIGAAKHHNASLIWLVFDTPLETCLARNRERRDDLRSEPVPDEVIRRQHQRIQHFLRQPDAEVPGQRYVLTPDDLDRVTVRWTLAPAERPNVVTTAPPPHERYDVVGDVHGCVEALRELLDLLGYGAGGHPEGRRLVFVGDFTDRGPSSLATLRVVMHLCQSGQALAVLGNHDDKLRRYLRHVYEGGKRWDETPITIANGMETTVAEFRVLAEADPDEAERFARAVIDFLGQLPLQLVLDHGRLVVSHAGVPAHLIGVNDRKIIERYALYGDPTGEVDAEGRPVRRDLRETYRGVALNVYGHTVVPYPAAIVNNACNVDTGAAFGGYLTALRYPERTFLAVPGRSALVRTNGASDQWEARASPERGGRFLPHDV